MNNEDTILNVILEGDAVSSGKIPISHLLELLSGLQKAFYRTGQILLGGGESTKKGPRSKYLKQLLEIELVEITHGSPSTLLRFEKKPEQGELFETEELNRILTTSLKGIREIQKNEESLPYGFDRGVLLAWRDIGSIFSMGVNSIKFEISQYKNSVYVEYTPNEFEIIKQRILGQQTLLTTIEGRLLMADFREEGMRLRIHPSYSDPVFCDFDEEQKEEVLENLLRIVRITGEAIRDPLTGRIGRIRIKDIEPLEEFSEAIEEIPVAREQIYDFWASRTLEDLVRIQGVEAVSDITTLYGTWPGDTEDGFEEFVQELRQGDLKRRERR